MSLLAYQDDLLFEFLTKYNVYRYYFTPITDLNDFFLEKSLSFCKKVSFTTYFSRNLCGLCIAEGEGDC